MKVITQRECERTEQLAEAYLDNELPAETAWQIVQHLSRCKRCRELVARREWMKGRIRESVRAVAPPLGLAGQVRALLRAYPQGGER